MLREIELPLAQEAVELAPHHAVEARGRHVACAPG